jgi:hypothetical protein
MHSLDENLQYTTDHDEIRRWVEERRGNPAFAMVKGNRIPIINFASGLPFVANVTWEEWLRVFEEDHYAFVCKDSRIDGRPSQFCQLVPRSEDPARNG